MSPPTRLHVRASMSAGERTTRAIVAEPRFSIDVAEPGDDAIGVGLAERLRPRAVADVELAAASPLTGRRGAPGAGSR